MIAPPRTGWQTLIADLSIILFMVTAGALARGAPAAAPSPATPARATQGTAPPVTARPLSVWREEPGGPPLAEWLSAQPRDPRQQLTIVLHYRPGEERALAPRMAALLTAATHLGMRVRIVAEPGSGGVTAGLAFDAS